MTHLNIQQGSNVEIVSALIIKKLYDTALTVSEPLEGETDAAYMSGHILTDVTYKSYVNYLAGNIGEGNNGIVTSIRLNPSGRFQELRIDVTNGYAIPFEDPNMLQYLLNLGVGSNGIITTVLAAEAASDNSLTFINTTDTTVTKFNELKYFTNITGSKGGFNGSRSGYIKFKDWAALEEIDISNFTSIGHSSNEINDTFCGCTALKTVTASNKLKDIGWDAFRDCSNLEDIIDSNGLPVLSGTINVYPWAFYNCSKLKDSNFNNCLISLEGSTGNLFYKCTALTSISLVGSHVYNSSFRQCSSLQNVTGLSNITSIPQLLFELCTSLTNVDIDWSKITSLGKFAFKGCPIGTGLTLELNLTNQTSNIGGDLEGTKFNKIIMHCNSAFVGDSNYQPFKNLPYTTYLDLSDFVLSTVSNSNTHSQSSILNNNSLVTVVYPPSVNFIYYNTNGIRNAIGTLRYMIILNETPPELDVDANLSKGNAFPANSTVHIYVPDSAVSVYLSDSDWSLLGGNNGTDTLSLRLHGLSELPAGVWTTGLASQYLTQALLATS